MSQVLARVSGGETVEITNRGHPIARLVPVGDDRSVLAKLVAARASRGPHRRWLCATSTEAR
ncbi:type II toxin-antitoxin system prevent-host-death family antitoxin [Micromonospora rifamycinica]